MAPSDCGRGGTALHISNLIAELPLRITRLAPGIPREVCWSLPIRKSSPTPSPGRQQF